MPCHPGSYPSCRSVPCSYRHAPSSTPWDSVAYQPLDGTSPLAAVIGAVLRIAVQPFIKGAFVFDKTVVLSESDRAFEWCGDMGDVLPLGRLDRRPALLMLIAHVLNRV